MVIYSFKDGIERIALTTKKPISNYNDVEQLDIVIRKVNGFNDAIAINFKLLREYEE